MNRTHQSFWKTTLSCTLAFSLAACSTTPSQNTWHDLGPQRRAETFKPSVPPARWGVDTEGPDVSNPVIAPGFLLSLHSMDDSKLTGDYRVDMDGNVALPYDKTVDTTGITVLQLERKLAELYRPYFKTSGEVKVHVRERRYWVDVRGLVQKPGRYLAERNTSLDQLIAMAGGLDKDASPRYVRMQKGSKSAVIDINRYMSKGDDRGQIVGWYGGDVLFFQKESGEAEGTNRTTSAIRLPVTMMGEVKKPGEFPIRADNDFVDFLTQAEGFTEAADLQRIQIIRRSRGRLHSYEFTWDDFARAPSPMEGDVVIVHADKQTKSERKTLLTIAFLSAAASIATAAVLVLSYNNGSLGAH